MSESSTIEPSPFAGGYTLSSDLAKLCLPSEFRDDNRKLAWVNSICFLFLLIGAIGLKAPKVVQRPVTGPAEVVPVVFTPPEELPKPQPEVKPDEPQPDTTMDTPQVATVVAAADASQVAFAVPVVGAVAVKEARFATPPPPANQAPRPRTFIPGQGEGGRFPWPHTYPREAMDQHAEGTLMLYVVVDPNGTPVTVETKDSSGHYVLDRFAAQWIKGNWRWLPGETRYFYVPFQFKLE